MSGRRIESEREDDGESERERTAGGEKLLEENTKRSKRSSVVSSSELLARSSTSCLRPATTRTVTAARDRGLVFGASAPRSRTRRRETAFFRPGPDARSPPRRSLTLPRAHPSPRSTSDDHHHEPLSRAPRALLRPLLRPRRARPRERAPDGGERAAQSEPETPRHERDVARGRPRRRGALRHAHERGIVQLLLRVREADAGLRAPRRSTAAAVDERRGGAARRRDSRRTGRFQ